MKKIAYPLIIKSAVSLAALAMLVACGGSEPANLNSDSNANATSNTTTTNAGTITSLNNNSTDTDEPQTPALTLSALDHLPTIDVSQDSAVATNLDAKETALVNLDKASYFKNSARFNLQNPVLGFIVKYKNQGTSSFNGSGNATIQSNLGNSAPLIGTSQILASGMSVGMANVASKNNIQLSFKADRYNASKVFSLGNALEATQAQKIAQEMQAADPNIEYVALNKIKKPSLVPNDINYTANNMWALQDSSPFGVKAETAWNTSNGAGVVVAVVDSGYRPHVDLSGRILPGYDFISNHYTAWDFQKNKTNDRDSDARDTGDYVPAGYCYTGSPAQNSSWHGSHVAGTIAANTNNKIGISGLAYGAKILPVRAMGGCGGEDTDITDGIVWAAGGTIPGVPKNKYPAKIINLSLGGASDVAGVCDDLYKDAIDTARSLGAIVVVAAGNGEYSPADYTYIGVNAANTTPANCANAITVGATDSYGYKTEFSNFGANVDISAPGDEILSTVNASPTNPGKDDAYEYYRGTSMATPHVSAALALMLSGNPRMTSAQAEVRILQSVGPFSRTGCYTGGCGTGILDASKAVITFAGAHAPADFDGNGKTDLVIKKPLASYNEIALGYINGKKMTTTRSFNTSNTKSIVAIGDFNGDKRADILEATTSSGRIANFIYMNGTKISSIKTVGGLQPSGSKVFGAADLNADGKDDLLLRASNGDFMVALMPTGDTNLSYVNVVNVPTSFVYKGTGDTNGDGKLEVFWQDLTNDELKVITMNGSTLVSNETGSASGLIIEGVGRFINKTVDSILVKDNTNALFVVPTHSSGTFNSTVALKNTKNVQFILPANSYIASTGDYDGNGQDDILWRQINSTKAGVLSMSGLYYTSVALPAIAATSVIQGKP